MSGRVYIPIGCITYAAFGLLFVLVWTPYRSHSVPIEYSLAGVSFLAVLLVAYFAHTAFDAFLNAVILAAPPLSYHMASHGLLELAGIAHAFSIGLWALMFHFGFRRWFHRERTVPTKPVEPTGTSSLP